MMGRIAICLLAFLQLCLGIQAQELFIKTEPASNLPKGVWGFRGTSELYREGEYMRSMNLFRVMYGVSPKLTLWIQANASDHHDRLLPKDLLDDETGFVHTHDIETGDWHPMLFNGFHLYGKYLFYTQDDQNSHFRAAVYGELSSSFTAHDEAEPNLMDDNAGLGAGLVLTQLYKRFAASITVGGVLPFRYKEDQTGIEVFYGNALNYSLSLGYLLAPFRYENYKQTNISLYAEFLGKAHKGGQLYQNGDVIIVGSDTPALLDNNYLEFHPGIQFIFNSNTRLDLGMGFRLLGRSFRHTYPLYFVQLQQYLYKKKK